MVVSGVTSEYEDEVFFETAAVLVRIEEVLVAGDAMLACELSEPTVFGSSARKESISSAGARAGSDIEGSRRDLAAVGSSGRLVAAGTDWPLRAGLSARPDDGGSCVSFLAFSFSRTMALSLAAWGAAGKN